MKKLSSSQIRQMYLDFFQEKGHTIEPSSSLIPVDDPTLLWINSGVATMKKYFDGSVVPENPRMTSSQKSIRTNDIENVGKTPRHHTLFEMLGNFSVGDYFKEDAIKWAYELLTSEKWFAWDPNKLYMTVYPKDTEAKEIWLSVGVPEDHIIEVDDNFWDIGQGPSGPDSEIFYDRGPEFNNLSEDDPENYPGGENERYLEVWNIVFSQFNHKPDNTYEPLPRKNIDTGMGLERVVSIFQNAKTNFETDLFLPIIHKTEELSGKKYGENAAYDESFRVIADHARAITVAIGDGALPSNEGRGYVIRRLIRRAIVNGQKLGIDNSFMYLLVPIVGEILRSYYPEVLEQSDYISDVVKSEENRFNETLSDGMKLLNEVIDNAKQNNVSVIDGPTAFKLYDTYGFPLELTKESLEEIGLTVDVDGFAAEMEKQKERARNARSSAKSMGVQRDLLVEIKDPSEYVGYTNLVVNDAELTVIVKDESLVDTLNAGETAEVIFDKTPFYAEMGGQVADHGVILDEDGNLVAKVVDVQHAPNGQNLHTIEVVQSMAKNNKFILKVDKHYHSKVEKNHTATHLLDQALRNVLGGHTQQAGSLVEPSYLRFDFTHFGQVTKEDLEKVEELVNEQIFKEIEVKTVETDPKTGKEMGAIALFSEKYGDKVRVVSIGDFSIEFCGGTHVKNTNEIGLFKIVSESGVGAGVRRIEAVTSSEAYELLNSKTEMLNTIADNLKVSQVKDLPNRIDQLQLEIKELKQRQESLEAQLANQQSQSIFEQKKTAGNYTLVTGIIKDSGMDQLRQLADTWRSKNISDVLVLGTGKGDKANLIVAVNDSSIAAGIKAGDLIKQISPKINGGGGGRPNMAQAGGKNPAGLNDAMLTANEWLSNQK